MARTKKSDDQKPLKRHVHLYFSPWQHESRAWRAGSSALAAKLTNEVVYVGYRVDGLPNREVVDDGQTILRIGAKPSRVGSPRILRALSLPLWWWSVVRTQNSSNVSLVTAHSLAALPAAVILARRCGAALLYDAHELETEREGWSLGIRRLAKIFEKALIRKCDHTIVVNDSILSWYKSTYPRLSVSTVRNVPVIPTNIGESRLRETLGISEDTVLYVYCGLFGKGRGLNEVIQAFSKLPDDFHIAFVGFGLLEPDVVAAASRYPNIHFHPAVSQAELITLLRGADVGVFLPDGASASYQNSLPNKVFEYSAAGLGLLVSDAKELKRFASEYPLAKSVPTSVDAIRQAVESWPKESIREGKATMTFSPPSWQQEVVKLLEAYEVVEKNHQFGNR